MGVGLVVGLAILGAAPVFASARVVVHPLVVMGGEARAVDQSKADFLLEAAQQPIALVPRGQVGDAVNCMMSSEGCLKKLCRDAGATYALLTSLELNGPAFVLQAKVVALDGTVMKKIDTVTIQKDVFAARAPQVKAAFKKVFAQLDLGSLPERPPAKPVPVAEVKQAPVAAVVVPAVARRQQSGPTGLRVAGLVVGGLAIVTAGVATGFAMSASSDSAALKKVIDANHGLPRGEVGRAQAIDSNTTIATGLYVGAGVVAAASVVMLITSIASSSPVAIAPIEGGAMVALGGTF